MKSMILVVCAILLLSVVGCFKSPYVKNAPDAFTRKDITSTTVNSFTTPSKYSTSVSSNVFTIKPSSLDTMFTSNSVPSLTKSLMNVVEDDKYLNGIYKTLMFYGASYNTHKAGEVVENIIERK